MRYGVIADRFIGAMSRLVHFRGAKNNTVGDLKPYFDLAPDDMFPRPSEVPSASIERNLIDRFARSSTVTWKSEHAVLCPHYRTRHLGDYRRNLKAYLRWVRPDGQRRRSALIYVHGWLEPGSWAEETTLFRKWGKELDVDLAHVGLPFHGPRKPRSAVFSGEFFWTADLVRTVEAVRQAVFDVRSAVSWLRAQGYEEVGVTGISLGGAVTMLLACLQQPPDFVVPIVSHLQLGEAVEEAPILFRMKRDLDSWGYDRSAREELFRRIGWHNYEPVLAPQRQLWICARDDVYIGARATERQWQKWQRPPIQWIDGGHMTFPLHIDAMTARIAAFHKEINR